MEAGLDGYDQISQSVVFGVEVPGTDGKAGMGVVTLRDGELDGNKLAAHLYDVLPAYAIPLFVRVVDHLEATSTFKNRKVELRDEGYSETGDDPLYVLKGRSEGYVEYYEGYVDDVANAKVPKN